ncbi:RNA dependent RNA polymerase-domain-containing protein [Talaromyces proteolyticus]|uniref:RNA-dependent RNA polymerase n=1 Tax=Talaromyces proteolyticus TaxID=1131652 RepID=A0AAD4L3V1_9EURO|nr:RNA dependent RNA polymerase-domain-containing protein [Talaromyces proteolyticus]KAH8703723.1 RNA dependent RNA polymerase-domain-containing protein [Talaromyces proteolyticus]
MDCWYRQTDIVHRHPEWPKLPVSLRKTNPIIDIGRWTTFRITYDEDTVDSRRFASLHEALRDFNIEIKDDDEFKVDIPKVRPVPVIWDVCDEPEGTRSASAELMGDSYVLLPFSIRYQLEVCISNGFISEYAATNEAFVHRLKDIEERKALALLEHVATDKKVYWNPMEIFDILFPKASTRRKIPAYCCMMHATTVTPTMVYWDTPSMEITNRVIRNFSQYSDRFLRVRFKGEKLEGRINSTNHNTMDEIFTRIKRTMSNGIKLGNRKYEFLAFGNSQFREHGAYFFASDSQIGAAQIRGWMGEFSDIRNIAKYAARIGQCFSTTRAIYTCSVQLQRIHDVTRGAYTFSDGVGRMSRFLAQMTQQELHIKTPDRDPPSAYQFRLGGCKGMLVLSSQARGQEIHIRPSQEKFPAEHQGLEVIRWSQFSMATLNRQLISVLSSLGVSDSIFHQKLQRMLSSLEEITKDDKAAMSLLQKYIDPNEMTLTISQMVSDGFLVVQEPFLVSLLSLWRAWQIKYLKEKAKIVIDGGACVLGVMDETGTLQGFSNEKIQNIGTSHEDRLSALPEIFLKVYRADEKRYCVIEGVCLLARNPSLHPGDIRVVKAVNKRELGDLKDVVVLPQLGDRDIASMCSGGDLDGDDYLVIWDQDLIPEDWFRTPMDYTPVKGVNLDRPVTVNDVTSFFVNYMKNDCLPKIAHAHMAWSDLLPRGVEEIKCIRLAKMHSDAVDYNKTGQPAYLSRELRPRKWPHFMEKNYKPKDQIYTSKKILGQLYDAVDRVDFYPNFEMPFDQRILESGIVVKDELVEFSKELKVSYDLTMRRIMAQQEIRTEFEVWSTFVLNHANQSKDYKFHEELGRISKSLRDRFQGECYDKIGSRQFEHVAPLVVAMYKVTSDEVTAALVEFHSTNPSPDLKPKINSFPMISFAWLFPDILGRIALRYFEDSDPALVNPAVDTQATELKAGKETGGVKIDQDVEKVTTLITDDLISLFDDLLSEASLEQSLENQMIEEDANLVEDEADIMPSAIDSLQNMLHDSDEDNLYDP